MNDREMLRHTVATLAYRGGKAVREAPDRFSSFKTEADIRTPGQILAHIGDLLDWARELATQLFQGPVADALTHVGQIAMLRRMFGSPVRGENYLKAEIVVGRVGPDQSAPRREFG
jgi:hypothetical protein